jgi:hypothetical protein
MLLRRTQDVQLLAAACIGYVFRGSAPECPYETNTLQVKRQSTTRDAYTLERLTASLPFSFKVLSTQSNTTHGVWTAVHGIGGLPATGGRVELFEPPDDSLLPVRP